MKSKSWTKDLRQKCQSALSRNTATTPAPPTTLSASYSSYGASVQVIFVIFPMPQKTLEEQPWLGKIRVKTANVAQLMKDGFSFGPESILREEGYLDKTSESFSNEESFDKAKWPWTRHFYLRDTQQSGKRRQTPPRWMAHLECVSPTFTALSEIRPCEITHHEVVECWAWGADVKNFYQFVRQLPEHCFNFLYDDMPLEGLWPHPRPPGRSEEGVRQENPKLKPSPPDGLEDSLDGKTIVGE